MNTFEELTQAERLELSDYDREFAYEEFLADCERRGVGPLD